MTKKIKDTVDISGFGAVVKGLANITGKSFEKTLSAEVGMVLRGAAMKVKVASIAGRMSRGKRVGGIVPYNMPEGLQYQGHEGAKLITKRDGKYYHIGKPILVGRQPNSSAIALPNGAKGKNRKRGGKIYKRPYPGQAWLKSKFYGSYVPERQRATTNRIKHRGLTAGQFVAMAEKAQLTLPQKGISKDKLNAMKSPAVQRIVSPRSRGIRKLQQFAFAIEVGSKGIKMSGRLNVQQKLLQATRARVNLFKNQAIKKGFKDDMKKWMPSRYPLLFGK